MTEARTQRSKCNYCGETPEVIAVIRCEKCLNKSKIKIPFEWEDLNDKGHYTRRAKVFGGWIVTLYSNILHDFNIEPLFIPDPNHDWAI